MIDPRPVRHAPEHGPLALVGQAPFGPVDECLVDILRRNGGSNFVDEGGAVGDAKNLRNRL